MSDFTTIPGFPGYLINKSGTIVGKSGKKLRHRPLVPTRPGNLPYHMVALYGPEGRVDRSVHSLVLETFVGPCPEGMEARHVNGNVEDNRLRNLRWGTKSQNGRDKIRHSPNCKKCGKPLKGRNLLMHSNGVRRVRRCRSCHNTRTLAAYHAKKETTLIVGDAR